MIEKTRVGIFAALVLSACGGGAQSSSDGTTSQGTAAPHIECGAGNGHHGGGCSGDGSGGESTTPAGESTPSDVDAGMPVPTS